MKRMLLCVTLALTLCLSAFASTPTGSIQFSFGAGACPSSGGLNGNATLDANGNFYLLNWGGTLNPGQYCVTAQYSGDATHNPSSSQLTLTVTDPVHNTAITVQATPNPTVSGNAVTLSGNVAESQ